MMIDPADATRRKSFGPECAADDLLRPVFERGRRVRPATPLDVVRRRVRDELAQLHPGVKRFVNPHRYPVGLEEGLNDLRTALILDARQYR